MLFVKVGAFDVNIWIVSSIEGINLKHELFKEKVWIFL